MAFDKVYKASSTQTVFDLTVQLYGSMDMVFDLMDANPLIDNLQSDATGLDINYTINNNPVQKSFISSEQSVSTKPQIYINTLSDALLWDTDGFLLQSDGYKILL